jgi:uncharacterized membrane protein
MLALMLSFPLTVLVNPICGDCSAWLAPKLNSTLHKGWSRSELGGHTSGCCPSHASLLSSICIGWHKLRGGLKSLSLLILDAAVTVHSILTGSFISGSKNVVSLNSAVVTTVAWDWASKLESQFLGLHSMENIGSVFC